MKKVIIKLKSFIPIKIKSDIKNYLKYLKTRSIKELDSTLSYKTHNSEYEMENAYKRVIEIHDLKTLHTKQKNGNWNNLYNLPNSVGNFLDSNKKIKNLIDIGSGTGWFVNYVAFNYPNINLIHAIEPSEAAVQIAKKINGDNPKIKYWVGFADVELQKIKPDIYLVTTFAVFQHLNKRYTKKVIKELTKVLMKDSILILSEPIATSRINTFKLHYPRTKKFWKKNLKNFNVSFNKQNLIIAKKFN